jgi:hypothetical protein
VDPKDDSKTRWILQWFRFDPERNERRYVPVAAFTRKREFNKASRQLRQEIETRKAAGLSEDVEFVSGVQHHKGYLAETREMRLQDRARRRAWKKEGPPSAD